MQAPMWDLFCRVVDNHGDVGVCWRLAADLASRGQRVRLWIDDASALAWMAPVGTAGVDVRPWPDGEVAEEPGDVVIEAFGCELPEAFVARMAGLSRPCVWIDIEYLTAEGHAARSHGLASPQTCGPGAGLTKWFYFPGFVDGTGGVLREPDLAGRRARFDRKAWLSSHGLEARPRERIVSVFCYDPPALPRLLEALAVAPTLLLLAPGPAAGLATRWLAASRCGGALRGAALPYLPQSDFDALLWACDLNFVRGEDSFVRAQWAGAPFVWQAYPQDDGAHHAKVDAFMALHLAGMETFDRAPVERLWRSWNSAEAPGTLTLPETPAWAAQCLHWREQLLARPDLTSGLLEFVRRKS